MTALRRRTADDRGQSTVELALTLPVLLLIVIGIIDLGRIYSFSIATSNAAREAAVAAVRDPQAPADQICQRARDELGAGSAAMPCSTAPIAITCLRAGVACGTATNVLVQSSAGSDVAVTVTYSVPLLTGFLVGRVFSINPVPVGATATFAGLSE